MQDRVSELKRLIKTAEEADLADSPKVKLYKKELAELTSSEEAVPTSFGTIDVTKDEFEKSTSKFASVGLHLSEFGMPTWDTPNVSIAFPFTIVEEGENNLKDGKISTGIAKRSLWKMQEIFAALGEEPVFGKDKRLDLDKSLPKLAGKQALVLWVQQKGRKPGALVDTVYTKAVSVHPIGATLQSLGILEASLYLPVED